MRELRNQALLAIGLAVLTFLIPLHRLATAARFPHPESRLKRFVPPPAKRVRTTSLVLFREMKPRRQVVCGPLGTDTNQTKVSVLTTVLRSHARHSEGSAGEDARTVFPLRC